MALRTALTITAVLALNGCALLAGPYHGEQRTGRSTSLVDYLYPDGAIPPAVATSVPDLKLPLRVGLAFVPPDAHSAITLSETHRMALLATIREQFQGLDYIDSIEIIPAAYLRSQHGTAGMQQVARYFDVDVMALVSYDQVARTTENTRSLLYWTIVGAYLIEGTDHDTRTFVDLAVVDVTTTKLLLRAPGFNERRGDATHVAAADALARNSADGVTAAVESMNQNLALELMNFEERLTSKPDDINVSWRGGGGATGLPGLVLLGAFFARRRARRTGL